MKRRKNGGFNYPVYKLKVFDKSDWLRYQVKIKTTI